MKVLFISSRNTIAPYLACVINQEGHDVKLYLADRGCQDDFVNMVTKTDDWKKELRWVGKGPDGLIVFDDIGYGKEQDRLRKAGYSVFGGSAAADRLEADRAFGQKIFRECGMKIVPIKNFNGPASALRFMKKHKAPWVIKQNGNAHKNVNYVAHFSDGRDSIRQMETHMQSLHERIFL